MIGYSLVIPTDLSVEPDWEKHRVPLSKEQIGALVGGDPVSVDGFDCIARDETNHKGVAFMRQDAVRYDASPNKGAEFLWKGSIKHAMYSAGLPMTSDRDLTTPYPLYGDVVFLYGDDEFMEGLK